MRKRQFPFCTRDAHIAQAALLFKILIGISASLAGKNALLHTNQKHIREFQSLCRVQRHQHHHIGLIVVIVEVANESDLLQKALHACLGPALVGVNTDAGNQLADIFQPRLAFVPLGLQHAAIAGDL